MFQQLYGSARVAAGGAKRLFAESADQLHLEAAAAAGAASPAGAAPAPAGAGIAAAAAAAGAAARQQEAATLPKAVVQQQAAVERALQPSAKQNMDALSARLSGRMGGGAEVQLGFDAPVVGEGAPAAAAGRKRLAPERVGAQGPAAAPTSAELMPPPPPRPSGGVQDGGKRARLEATPVAAGGVRAAGPAAGAAAGAAGGGAAPVAALPHIMLRGPELPAEVTADLGCTPQLFEDPAAAPAEEERRTLRVTNRDVRGAAGGGRWQADVACLKGRGAAPLWSDTLRSAAVAACGTHNFAAVGTDDGQLVVSAGRGLGVVQHRLVLWADVIVRGACGSALLPAVALSPQCLCSTPLHLAALLPRGPAPHRPAQAGRRHRQAGLRLRVAPAGADHQRRGAPV